MKDESPNGLVMSPEPVVARMGRWPLYALLIVLILLNFIPDILEEDKKKNLNTE